MNWDEIKGKWTSVKGQLREQYGDLTDDEIEEAKGSREQMVGLIQSKYGKAKDEAEKEFDKVLAKA